MSYEQFTLWVMALRSYFPREKLLPNEQAVELWFRELKDIPYEMVSNALRTWVQTNSWSPSIADIRELCARQINAELPDWGEAWQRTINAISKYGYMQTRAALDSLDPLTRRCVERMGFRQLCQSENPTADRASFRQIFEQLAHQQLLKQQTAKQLRELTERQTAPQLKEQLSPNLKETLGALQLNLGSKELRLV